MNICMIGEGAFGHKHLDALSTIDGVKVASLVGGVEQATRETAARYEIPHYCLDLDEGLAQPGVEAAIIASPTPIHAAQGMAAMRAGKHVMIEIPMADNLADAEAVCAVQRETGLVAMAGHTRRFNPSHQWVHNRIKAGELEIQQMEVQTFFFRRENLNALGQPRSWTDHLLWHHAAHTIDLFAYQTGEEIVAVQAMQGPRHPQLGIAMDMGIGLKTTSGALCTLSL